LAVEKSLYELFKKLENYIFAIIFLLSK